MKSTRTHKYLGEFIIYCMTFYSRYRKYINRVNFVKYKFGVGANEYVCIRVEFISNINGEELTDEEIKNIRAFDFNFLEIYIGRHDNMWEKDYAIGNAETEVENIIHVLERFFNEEITFDETRDNDRTLSSIAESHDMMKSMKSMEKMFSQD